jgi:hypothetical protein
MAIISISTSQLAEVWSAEERTALRLLSRIAEQPKYESDLRQSVLVDFLHQMLVFCKESALSVSKTFAVFDVMVETHSQACGERGARGALRVA